MTHARVARSSHVAAATSTRLLGALLVGGALMFVASQAAWAAPAAPAKAPAASSAASPCDEGMCPLHADGPHRHHGDRKGAHRGAGMKGGMKGGMGMGLPFAGAGFERVLDDVKATDAQRKQIREIADQARVDLRALHEKAHAQHQDAMAIWTWAKIDPAEAEKQRQQMLAHHDQASKRMMQAMLDVAQVLTPEQRSQAAAALKQRRERMQEHQHQHDRHDHRHERMERRQGAQEGASDAGQERLQNHMLRRPAPAASASQPAPAR